MKEIKCYLCEKELNPEDAEDDFCYGCKQYICGDCDETGPMGSHLPEDHKKEEEMTTTVERGTKFRKWVEDWLKERMFKVHNQPHMSKRIIVRDKKTGELKEIWVRKKIDIFGCDILAMKGDRVIWIQTTLDPHIDRRIKELIKYFEFTRHDVQIWIKTGPGQVNIKKIDFFRDPMVDIDLGKILRKKYYSSEGVSYEF